MKLKTLGLAAILSATAAGVQAEELQISISNLTAGTYFTPILIAAHDNDTFAFRTGTAASAELRIQAEGGNPAPLKGVLDAAGATTVANPVAAEAAAGDRPALPDGNPGLLAPGETTNLTIDPADGNNYLSVTAMILPTNDGFIGLNSWPVPTEPGTYTINLNAYDAGTEANDELITGMAGGEGPGIPACPGGLCGDNGNGVVFGGADADNKVNDGEVNVVHIHRNVLGDNDPNGGISDLNSTAHRWLNPVARVVVTVPAAQ